jgi:glucose-1-phosphate adenylyltransferase
MNTQAMIMAGGQGTRLSVLSQSRVKPAVPFAGKYRLIDFVLSNCANSGILNVGILTQYLPHALNDHIRTGRPWDLDRGLSGGVTLLPPYQRNGRCMNWYCGTADAVYQNLDFIETDTVLILSSDHVYKMDYAPLLRYHQRRRADVTICATDVPLEKATRFGVLVTDEGGRVVEFQEKPRNPPGTLISMGIYVFRTDVLVQRLAQDAQLFDSGHDFGKDVLPRMLALGDRLYAYRFEGYWVDVGTVPAYWEANMDLLRPDPPLKLLDPHWSIRTRSVGHPPLNVCPGAAVSNSLITDGCVIEGRVEGSVLSPGVRVRPGAVVRDSVVFDDCEIGAGAIVERAILDKNVVVGTDAHIGAGPNVCGLTLVGKNTRLPPGLCVGCRCVIGSDLIEDDFTTDRVINGRHADRQSSDDAFVTPRHALMTASAFG